jgi:predicted GTPase
MSQQDEEEKGSDINILGSSHRKCDNVLNVLIFGTSGSGKSSLINYLAGKLLAPEGDSGSSCTDNNKSYEVTLHN